VSNCMSVSCAHLVCFTISDSKWYWNHTGYRAVDAVCLLQKRIKRGSQAAITSHTYMSMPKEQGSINHLPAHSLSLSLSLLACGYTCTTTSQLFISDVLAKYFVVLLQFSNVNKYLEGVGPLICERKALVLFCHQLFIMLI
jgi:hypothetical protein